MNSWIVLWIVAIIVLIIIIKKLSSPTIINQDEKEYFDLSHYRKKRYFFTRNENFFFKRLIQIISTIDNNRYIIFSKVRVSDVIETDKKSKWSWKKINPRHFDFVICDINNDFQPIIIIELDDKSHDADDVNQRDKIKNDICKYINLPLLRTYWIETDEQLKHSLLEIL